MYMTKKGQYALIFMIELALNMGNPVTVKKVAKSYSLSEKYMEQIATQLSHSGVAKVTRGSKGGYYITSEMVDYTLYSIVASVEGKKSASDVDLSDISEDNRVMNGIVGGVSRQLEQAVKDVLMKTTLSDLVRDYKDQMAYSYII